MVQPVFLGGSHSLWSACAVSWVWSTLFPSFHSVSPHWESSVGLSLIHTCCSYGSHLFVCPTRTLARKQTSKQDQKNKMKQTKKTTSPGFIQKMYINQSVCEYLKGFVCKATAVLLKPQRQHWEFMVRLQICNHRIFFMEIYFMLLGLYFFRGLRNSGCVLYAQLSSFITESIIVISLEILTVHRIGMFLCG